MRTSRFFSSLAILAAILPFLSNAYPLDNPHPPKGPFRIQPHRGPPSWGRHPCRQPEPPGLFLPEYPPGPPSALKPKGELVYAPAPFKTVTAAISRINTNINKGRLPWKNPATGKWIDFIVIRCNPGLYGPSQDPGNETDPLSGLPWNGESFPITLPDRVSFQGASALNTIFDARRYHFYKNGISFFAIDNSRHFKGEHFRRVFIDGISIRGARGKPQGGPLNRSPKGRES